MSVLSVVLKALLLWDSEGLVNRELQRLFFWPELWLPITFAGTEVFYLLLIPLVYLLVDRRAGVTLLYALLLTGFVNALAKLAFHEPRPFWVITLRVASGENSYGLPSGHAQNAVVVWGYLASLVVGLRKWPVASVIIATTLWVLLISFSRLVLGVHFVQDLVVGWMIGGGLLWGTIRGQPIVAGFFSRLSPAQRIFFGVAASVIVLQVGAIAQSAPGALPAWSQTAALSMNHSGPYVLDPVSMKPFLNVAGALLGATFALSAGIPGEGMIERAKGIGRLLFFLGLCWGLIFGIDLILSSIFPVAGFEGGALRVFRYAITVFVVILAFPWVMERIDEHTSQ